MTLTERLLALWDHLGLTTAHVATQLPDNLAGLAAAHPERIAGVLLSEPLAFDPLSLRAVAARTVIVAGDGGLTAAVAAAAAEALPESRRIVLHDYATPPWADHVRDHAGTIVAALRGLPGEAGPVDLPAGRGVVAEIRYQIQGAGPALVLFPLFLAPTQWDAAAAALAESFTVIRLGGAHLGGASLLEGRARSPSYAGMVRLLHDTIAPAPGESLLEVGCGSGALARLAAARPGAGPVTAADLSAYLLGEAAALAEQAGLAERIAFREADAERLPFAQASFDHAYSVTVLEECDADRALRELLRVVRPGGRVGVIARAIDQRHWWQAELPEAIREKVSVVPPMISPGGVADASLYRRMAAAGFVALTCLPATPSFAPGNRFFNYMAGRAEARLDAAELPVFRAALHAGAAAGTLFATFPHHGAVGLRPAAT